MLLSGHGLAVAQPVGEPPVFDVAARDMMQAYALPPLKDDPRGPLGRGTSRLQVLARAHRLGLDVGSAETAWRGSAGRLAAARTAVEAARRGGSGEQVVFAGERVSDLNRLLHSRAGSQVRVTTPHLIADEPLLIDRDGVRVDLGQVDLSGGGRQAYLIRIEHARNVVLLGGTLSGNGSGVLVSQSDGAILVDQRLTGLTRDGVVVTGSRGTVIWGDRVTGTGGAPLLLHGATTGSVVAENRIENNVGASNWNAGVVVTDRNADLAADPLNLFLPDHYGVIVQPITDRLTIPRDNLIALNVISDNRASGIYFDGAAQDVVVSNLIEGNAKEGMCLDNGSTANVVALNTIAQNGKRWGSSDEDLKRDFIAGFGRTPDGSATAKVPGLSLDNAAYNIVYANEVERNFGGGIKMVRTSYFNIVGLNTLVDDNEGRSDRFHFFGIELGAASADVPVPDLDFTPSRGNIVFSNLVRGSHYAGVFFAPGSDLNDLFDNAIFNATNWAIESAGRQNNSTLNNLTNLPSRNADPGLDPRLAAMTAGSFD